MTRSGGLPRYRASIPGRIEAEDRGEMAKVNENMGFYAEILLLRSLNGALT